MPPGIDPKVDFAFKRMLGSPEHPAVTIHFLNSVLQLTDPVTDVEILNPIQDKAHFSAKQAVLDVLARDNRGRRLNIEMQTTLPEALCERLTYYNCLNYVRQIKHGEEYEHLRPTISICVLDKVLFRAVNLYHLSFRLHCDQTDLVFSNDLEFHTLELPKFQPASNNVGAMSPVDKWAFLLKYAPEMELDALANLLGDAAFYEAIGVLVMISKSEEELILYESRVKAARDEQARLRHAQNEGRE
ncbi:PD-(D/E)XK nuclease family transposase [Anatilimnocola aggregata]|uniref:PD-(D/E)XK nuclease family transposase n=1 Tax=Anatilimnocola aggregata TaxID=2528021 RepID=A0A517YI43_9BACT|nr:Rpn family recombination-promoting nuclease/putative transposase [Anatilimnocola aggregata]QDU29882.1 PD-(D/E)XK nuclease family transposase [Anatilimnocola aggregata]